MNKIVVRKSSILINNYDMGDSYSLERFFSVWDKLTHQSYPKGIYYNTEKHFCIVPRGIDVSFLENIFGENAYYEDTFDPMDAVDPIMLKYLPRDDTQKIALDFVLGLHQYQGNSYRSQLSLNLNTGAGKTYVAIAMASYISQRMAMITSSIGWINQWRDCILEYTDTTEEEIYIISGVGSIAKILNGMKDIKQYKFILISHSTIRSYGEKYGWEAVGELFKILRIGIKVYDEAHLNFDNICMIDFFTNTNRTIYLTATPARSDNSENIIYQMALKNVPKIDLFNQDSDPHTKYIAIHYNSHPNPSDIQNCKNAYGFDRLKYIRYIIGRPNFFKMLTVVLDIALRKEGKILIYIGANEIINYVANWLCNTFPQLDDEIGIYNSTIPKEFKEVQLSKKIILSTTKSCGAAMDIRGLKTTIVLAEPFKSEVLARQTLGRTRDSDTYYLDIIDRGFSSLIQYYSIKRKVFAKYAETCTDIHVTDLDLDEKYNEIFNRMKQDFSMSLFEKRKNELKQIIHRESK